GGSPVRRRAVALLWLAFVIAAALAPPTAGNVGQAAAASQNQAALIVTPRGPRPAGAGTVTTVGNGVDVSLHNALPGRRLEAFACKRKELTDFLFHQCARLAILRTDATGALVAHLPLPPRHPPLLRTVL